MDIFYFLVATYESMKLSYSMFNSAGRYSSEMNLDNTIKMTIHTIKIWNKKYAVLIPTSAVVPVVENRNLPLYFTYHTQGIGAISLF